MVHSTVKTDPVPIIAKSNGTLRIAALVASIASLFLPAITSSAMGLTQSASMLQLAGWFLIVPAAIAVTVAMPGLTPQFSRVADIAAAIITLVMLAYAGSVAFDAWREVSQITGQATGILRSMAGNNAQMQNYANNYSQTLGVAVMPGIGLAAMAMAAALMSLQALRGSK